VTEQEKYADYLEMLRKPFQKLCRLRFLQPDGSTAFLVDNNPKNTRSGTFIADGTITHNWQNGRRTSVTVRLDNVDGEYDYAFNHIWFGQEIALDEGLILSDGETEFYIQQGIFLIETPEENVQPTERTAVYSLVDKAAFLDGSLGGKLDGTYQVSVGTNIFAPIAALLAEDRGNGQPTDRVQPVFTEYYNGMTQALPDGSTVSMVLSPYTLTVDAGQTKWDVIAGLAAMVNAWVGYDESGALRLDPSQDDILDTDKPVLWAFSTDEAELCGMSYTVKNTDVYNDVIVVGDAMSDNRQPKGRAEIFDARSPVDINAIGRKTIRIQKAGFATDTQCRDYAEWQVKRTSVLQRAVEISCSQMFHIRGNKLLTLERTDKEGSPVERHLVQGFSRPLAANGAMRITATSVNDFYTAAVTPKQNAYLKFSSPEAFTLTTAFPTVKPWDGTLETSTDGGATWTEFSRGDSVQSGDDNTVLMRGSGNTKITGQVAFFRFTGSDIRCSGNVESLLDYRTFEEGGHPQPANYALRSLFESCDNLVSGPDVSTVILTEGCLVQFYWGCTALTEFPVLRQKTFGRGSCIMMCSGCTSLKLSASRTGDYQIAYRVPESGMGIDGGSALSYMFGSTGGTFVGTPSMNTTYYTPVVFADNCTEVVINVPANRLEQNVNFAQTQSRGVFVDWGDGSSLDSDENLEARISHTYAAAGTYRVRLQAVNGTKYAVGDEGGWSGFIGSGYGHSRDVAKVVLDSSVTVIRGLAFSYNSSMTEITLPPSLVRIGVSAFEYCNTLTRVNIDDIAAWCGVELGNSSNTPFCSGAGALYSGGELVTDLEIPYGVTKIKRYVFAHCKSIQSVTIPDSVTSVAMYAFEACPNLASISVSEGNPAYKSDGGLLLNKSGTSLAFVPRGYAGALTVPDGVERIERSAASETTLVTSVSFPTSLKLIDKYAFWGSGISGNLMLAAQTIEQEAFSDCEGLEKVWLRSSVLSISMNSGGSQKWSHSIFYGTSASFTLYCEPASRPSGWHEGFNYKTTSAEVNTVWGRTTQPW